MNDTTWNVSKSNVSMHIEEDIGLTLAGRWFFRSEAHHGCYSTIEGFLERGRGSRDKI
jgi:hypothetical protein